MKTLNKFKKMQNLKTLKKYENCEKSGFFQKNLKTLIKSGNCKKIRKLRKNLKMVKKIGKP